MSPLMMRRGTSRRAGGGVGAALVSGWATTGGGGGGDFSRKPSQTTPAITARPDMTPAAMKVTFGRPRVFADVRRGLGVACDAVPRLVRWRSARGALTISISTVEPSFAWAVGVALTSGERDPVAARDVAGTDGCVARGGEVAVVDVATFCGATPAGRPLSPFVGPLPTRFMLPEPLKRAGLLRTHCGLAFLMSHSRRASDTSAAVWKRSSGFFAIIFRRMLARSVGTSPRSVSIAAGSFVLWLKSRCGRVPSGKGG